MLLFDLAVLVCFNKLYVCLYKKKKKNKKKKKEKKKRILLFTNYGPTRGMNIHIYNYLKHNICLTKTKIQ